jgi:16S rRNA (guanine966-N2)-methyltransferase
MRIIAGTHRSRPLLSPPGDETTRPITDRVKENLFNRLTSLGLLAEERPGEPWRVADIFSGTGSLGIECLSRGAAHCLFVEQDRKAARLLQQNLDELELSDRGRVVVGSAFSPVWPQTLEPASLRLITLDPPYAMSEDDAGRQQLLRLAQGLIGVLEPGGVIVWRAPTGLELQAPAGLDLASVTYGSQALHLLQRPLDEAAPDEPLAAGDAP